MALNKNYRADIDGLRAIAVTSVILHHLSNTFLPGGFVGVDIFFVISGFLITSQIYKEITNHSFSIIQFYKRRINRIAPALFCVILVCIISGYFILSPSDFTRLTTSSFLSFVGLSNIYFWHIYGNYFAGNTQEAILLHTWSLGIEEQFYVLWPWIILLFTRFFQKHLLLILSVVTAIAILVSIHVTNVALAASYYLLPTRFFELAIGGMVAIIVIEKKLPNFANSKIYNLIGLALIAYSLIRLNRDSLFPGINALIPCMGAALLIWTGSNTNKQLSILSNKYMTFVGQISYSLYLWHWPIIAYLNYLYIPITFVTSIFVISLSVLLAWLSWKYIEVPFRTKGNTIPFKRIFVKRFSVPAMSFLLLCFFSYHFKGLPQRFDPMVSSFELNASTYPEKIRKGCHVPSIFYKQEPNLNCKLGKNKREFDGLLIGDSYANHFTGLVDVLAKDEGISVMDYTMSACPPILNYSDTHNNRYSKKCEARNDYIFRLLKRKKFKYVILAASWSNDDKDKLSIERTIQSVLSTGSKAIVILNNQRINNGSTCPIRNLMYKSNRSCDTKQTAPASYWSEIRKNFPNVTYIDPNLVLCNHQLCTPVIDRTLVYRDDGHINDDGSRIIGKKLLEKNISLIETVTAKNKGIDSAHLKLDR